MIPSMLLAVILAARICHGQYQTVKETTSPATLSSASPSIVACPAGYQIRSNLEVIGAASVAAPIASTLLDIQTATDVIFYNVDEHGSTSFLNGALPSGESIVYASQPVVIVVTPTPVPSDNLMADTRTVASVEASIELLNSTTALSASVSPSVVSSSMPAFVTSASLSAATNRVKASDSDSQSVQPVASQSSISMYNGARTFITTWNSTAAEGHTETPTHVYNSAGGEHVGMHTNSSYNVLTGYGANASPGRSSDLSSQSMFSSGPVTRPLTTSVAIRSISSAKTIEQRTNITAPSSSIMAASSELSRTASHPTMNVAEKMSTTLEASSPALQTSKSTMGTSTRSFLFIDGPGPVILPSTWQLEAPTPANQGTTTTAIRSISNEIPGDETSPAWSLA